MQVPLGGDTFGAISTAADPTHALAEGNGSGEDSDASSDIDTSVLSEAVEAHGVDALPLDGRVAVWGNDSWPKLGVGNATTALVRGAGSLSPTPAGAEDVESRVSPAQLATTLGMAGYTSGFPALRTNLLANTVKAVRRQSNSEVVELELVAGTTAVDISEEAAMLESDADVPWVDDAGGGAAVGGPGAGGASAGSSSPLPGGARLAVFAQPSRPPSGASSPAKDSPLPFHGSASALASRSGIRGSFLRQQSSSRLLVTASAGTKQLIAVVPFPYIFPATEWAALVLEAASVFASQRNALVAPRDPSSASACFTNAGSRLCACHPPCLHCWG